VIECLEAGEDAGELGEDGDLTPQPGAGLLRVSLTGAAVWAWSCTSWEKLRSGAPPSWSSWS